MPKWLWMRWTRTSRTIKNLLTTRVRGTNRYCCFVCLISYGGGLEEQDVFGSDFESTDEEAEQQGVDAGETMIREEEQRARRVRPFVPPAIIEQTADVLLRLHVPG